MPRSKGQGMEALVLFLASILTGSTTGSHEVSGVRCRPIFSLTRKIPP